MFTGIIEAVGIVKAIEEQGSNLKIYLEAPFLSELKVDQSVAHNGVCLTVDGLSADSYSVTAIQETIGRSNISKLHVGHKVNLERCMKADGRLDGHLVQGHVDGMAVLQEVFDLNGSWELVFRYEHPEFMTVEKGSVCVNGVSLTVVRSEPGLFSVAIIPYTWEHTNLGALVPGSMVNIEFDIIGKYIAAYMHKIYPKA